MAMTVYEERLSRDPRWALREGSMYFERESAVHKTLEAIARRLAELGVPYAVADGLALFFHGYRRFTEGVVVLVTAKGLAEIHRRLEGLGYVRPFAGSKNLRDTASGVRVEFLVAGDYPGDGRPKPAAFPEPDVVSVEIEGIRFLRLEALIELKLASGTAPGRRRDLADVQELIRLLQLPTNYATRLDPSVRGLYGQLWNELQSAPPEPLTTGRGRVGVR
jgi:hypothetical protein